MTVAQKLEKNGVITYMSTDSTTLSSLAVNSGKQVSVDTNGEEYAREREYKT